MNLYPQNLRDRQHAEIIKRRTYGLEGKGGTEGMSRSDPPAPHMGRLGRFWARKSGLTDGQAATGLPASAMATQSAVWLPVTLLGTLSALIGAIMVKRAGVPPEVYYSAWAGGMAALGAFCAGPGAGAVFRGLYRKPLGVSEIDHLLESAENDLERSYLTLVKDAIRQEVPEQSAEDIRVAVHALGEAIDRLPVVAVQPLDVQALREEATRLREEARGHDDRVIGDSLERKADALLNRADAHQRSALYVRRSAALRSEIEAQVEALREGLAAFNAGTSVNVNMGHLSESARRVAAEAVSTAEAQEEIDSWLGTTPPAATVPQGEPKADAVVLGGRGR